MARQINLNHVDTAVDGVSTLSVPISVLNYKADFGICGDTSKELILTNNTSPLDRPETIRYAVSDVANVYKNTNIDPNLFMDTKRGVSLLAQVNDVYTVTNTAVPEYERVAPVKAHLVIQIPSDAVITADVVYALVGRLVATLCDTGVASSSRLARMLRGSLRPSDLS